jgi:hypothetical protein
MEHTSGGGVGPVDDEGTAVLASTAMASCGAHSGRPPALQFKHPLEEVGLPLVPLGNPQPQVLHLLVFREFSVHAGFLGPIAPELRIANCLGFAYPIMPIAYCPLPSKAGSTRQYEPFLGRS